MFNLFSWWVPLTLIKKKTKGKKGIIAYNKGYGTNSIKWHVDFEYPNLAPYIQRFVSISMSMSQSKGDGQGVAIFYAKKHSKVVLCVIFIFFESNIPYSKHYETLKFFLEDLVLLTTKGYLLWVHVKIFGCRSWHWHQIQTSVPFS
jgi:hypothetical protein